MQHARRSRRRLLAGGGIQEGVAGVFAGLSRKCIAWPRLLAFDTTCWPTRKRVQAADWSPPGGEGAGAGGAEIVDPVHQFGGDRIAGSVLMLTDRKQGSPAAPARGDDSVSISTADALALGKVPLCR